MVMREGPAAMIGKGMIKVSEYSKLKRSYDQYMMDTIKVESRDTLDNEWIYGKSGLGKSKGVRAMYDENVYPKNANKWWCGYRQHEHKCVLIEDLGPEHTSWIAPFLKIWTDHYPFLGETKNSGMVIRPGKIVVTSQYSIDDLWPKSIHPETNEALHRRFKQIHFLGLPKLTVKKEEVQYIEEPKEANTLVFSEAADDKLISEAEGYEAE